MHSHSDEKDNAMWGLQYVKQQPHHDGKMAGHQVSPEKVFTLKSHCIHLIYAFKEHLLFGETPQILKVFPSFYSQRRTAG